MNKLLEEHKILDFVQTLNYRTSTKNYFTHLSLLGFEAVEIKTRCLQRPNRALLIVEHPKYWKEQHQWHQMQNLFRISTHRTFVAARVLFFFSHHYLWLFVFYSVERLVGGRSRLVTPIIFNGRITDSTIICVPLRKQDRRAQVQSREQGRLR